MSFLAGRLAGKEGAYFFQETKHALNRLAEKSATNSKATAGAAAKNLPSPSSPHASHLNEHESQADVLPEVLRHSLPSKVLGKPYDSSSSLSSGSKWALHSDPNSPSSASPDALNPLRAYLSLPQVTLGRNRWQLPNQEHAILASTANDYRKDKYTPINPEKLKAAAEGLTQLGKAFGVATAIVFGGATVTFSWAASKFELQNSDDIRTKGKDLLQPKFEAIKENLAPLRTWAEERSKKWHLDKEEDIKVKPIVKELSKIMGARNSN